jgi:hypothetical protein
VVNLSQTASDANMVNNWQHLCQELDVEVGLNDCTDVDNEASIVQELTEEEIVSEILVERNRASGNNVTHKGKKEDNSNDKNVVVTKTVNIMCS